MRKTSEYREITFKHTDDKIYTFKTERNTLNNAMMYTWDNWRSCFASDLRRVNSIIRDIKKKCKVIAEEAGK